MSRLPFTAPIERSFAYCFAAPRPPTRQELQTPKPLPTLATTPQPYARRASSPALKVAGVKAVSVTEYVPAAADVLAWSVVPHAAIPDTIVGVPASRAELLQLPPTGAVASNLITMEVGLPRVSGLMIRSLLADKDTKPLGVTGQEQQETTSSLGS